MLKIEVGLGKAYLAKISGKLVAVRIDEIIEKTKYRKQHWSATNLITNRTVTIKSGQKLRRELTDFQVNTLKTMDKYRQQLISK